VPGLPLSFYRWDDPDIRYDAEILDVGGGGLRFKAKQQLSAEEVVNMDFTVGGRQYSGVWGEVAQIREHGRQFTYGVKFRGLSDEERAAIIAYGESRTRARES
jgi:hypothetical protein